MWVRAVRVVGWAEAVSFLVLLLIAMPLKYWAGLPIAVRVVGSIHGAIFVSYVAVVLFTARRERWNLGRVATLIIAAFLPFGPFLADRAFRQGEPEALRGEAPRDGAAG